MADLELLLAVGAMAIASFACRAGGYVAVRYVPSSPELNAGFQAIPLSVMIGIIAPSILDGSIVSIAGVAAVITAQGAFKNDFIAMATGVASVAVLRWWGFD